jgi:hypothetical protein
MARLRKERGVHEATIFGQSIHALVDVDYSLERLAATGVEVRPAAANLEDVFVLLTGEEIA